MSLDHAAQENGGEDVNLTYMARKALGDARGKVSQKAFGELLGRTQPHIYKRESGKLGLKGTPRSVCELILGMHHEGLTEVALDALEGVPAEERSEDAALMALTLACVEKGYSWLVRKAMGDESVAAGPAAEPDGNVAGTLKIIARIQESLIKRARQVDPKLASHLEAAAGASNNLKFHIERFEQERQALEKDPPDEGNST